MLSFAKCPVLDLIPNLLQLARRNGESKRAALSCEIFRPRQDGYNAKADVGFGRPKELQLQRVDYDEPSGEYMADMFWRGDVLSMIDEAMGGISMERMRFEVLITRGG